jgi:probable HAF family extracellular repeat protein
MKSRAWMWMTAVSLFAALAVPVGMAAQDNASQNNRHQHHRYQLIDMGTFGGPDSLVPELQQIINSRGTVVGGSDTSIPDPNPTNCFVPECFVQHMFHWQDGVLRDMGALPGVNSSFPATVNGFGLVAGLSQNGLIDPLTGAPEIRAVLWKDGRVLDLGTLGGNESIGIGMNDQGQVIGAASNTIPDPISFLGATQAHAFLWQDGRMQDLGTLGGPDSFGQYVNNRGQVAGFSYTSSPPTMDPFLWDNGRMLDLGTLGGTSGQVNDLNNRGQVVGTSNLSGDMITHGFLWDRGVLTDLGTLGGDNASATWINDAGDVVGEADLPGSQVHDAFLWKHGVMTDLGNLGQTSFAYAINSEDQVVGHSKINDGTFRAILWENGGPMVDLNTLIAPGSGLQLTDAYSLNDRGEIAGNGLLPNGDQHAYLLIPCDEKHPGECQDYSMIEGVTSQTSAPAAMVRQGNETHVSPVERVRMMMQRYYIPRQPTAQHD